MRCYEVAAWLSCPSHLRSSSSSLGHKEEERGEEDEWIYVSARASGAVLQVGLLRASHPSKAEAERVEENAKEVAKLCKGIGGTLEAVGKVLEACICKEILGAKYVFLRK